MVPHVTNMIKHWIKKTSEKTWHQDEEKKEEQKQADICLVEVGGTVGDLESGVYFEAIR